MTTTLLCLAVLTGVLGVACSGETVRQPPPPPINWRSFAHAPDAGPNTPAPKENALGEEYVEALSSPGLARLGRLFDDDAHFAFPGRQDTRGRNEVVRAHDTLFGAFAQRRFVASR